MAHGPCGWSQHRCSGTTISSRFASRSNPRGAAKATRSKARATPRAAVYVPQLSNELASCYLHRECDPWSTRRPTVARMRPRVLRHSSDLILKRPDDTHSACMCSAARALHWHIIRQKRPVPAYRKKVTLARTQQKLTLHLALRLVLAVRPPLWHASLLSALPCASPLPQASWPGICWERRAMYAVP